MGTLSRRPHVRERAGAVLRQAEGNAAGRRAGHATASPARAAFFARSLRRLRYALQQPEGVPDDDPAPGEGGCAISFGHARRALAAGRDGGGRAEEAGEFAILV